MRRAGMEMGFLSARNGPLLAELGSSRSNMMMGWAVICHIGALTTVAASYRQIEPLSVLVRPVASCRSGNGRRGGVYSSRHTYQGPIDWIDDPSAC